MSSQRNLLARAGRAVGRVFAALALAAGAAAAAPPTAAADKPAAAQEDIDSLMRAFPEGMTAEQLDAVLAVTDDARIRAALRARLLAEMAARQTTGAPAPDAENLFALYARRLSAIAATYPRLPQDIAGVFRPPAGSETPLAAWRLLGALLLVFGLAASAMLAVRRLLAERRRRLTAAPATGGRRLGRLLLRLALDLLEIGALFLGGFVAFAILQPVHPAAPVILFAVLRAAVIVLLADKIIRFLCDPSRRDLRLVAVDDALAHGVHRAIVSAIGQTAAIIALLQCLAALGLPRDDLAALALPLSIVPNGYLLVLIWSRRREITAALARWLHLESDQAYLAGAVLMVATVYLVGLWLAVIDAVLRDQGAIGMKAISSLALFLLIPVAAWLIHWPVGRFYGLASVDALAPEPIRDEYGDALPSVVAVASQRDDLTRGHVTRLMRAVWIVLVVLAVIVTAQIWGFDPERHVGVGVAVVRIAFDISVILLIAYIAWALMVHAIDQALERARAEGKTTRAQRMATLLPLLRKFLQVLLLAMIVMIVLSAIGVDIGPLLAGAGVVGLAIGLGTQQTVADIVAGVFFLAEDAFRVGDYVEVGSIKGTVESISLRSLKLRHQRGAMHTLPFGQIKSLTNQTRDWSLVRLEFRVAPDTDVALVKRLVKVISKDLQTDPDMGPSFIDPLKSQGIRNVEDGALTIGIKYITRPGQQFVIRREAYSRIIAAFKENGIELVGRGVVVKVEAGDATTRAVAGAGAAEALSREAS